MMDFDGLCDKEQDELDREAYETALKLDDGVRYSMDEVRCLAEVAE